MIHALVMPRSVAVAAVATLALILAACGQSGEAEGPAADARVVNVYSARHYDADEALYARFTEQTGIRVNVVEGKADELIARLRAEGKASPADVFVAADAGALWRAQDAGLLQATSSEKLNSLIPANLRAPGGEWFGLARRARIVAYDPARVRPEEVDTYEEIASPRFRGKLCVRSSESVYNLSLVGALIEAWGPARARQWVEGVVANMARPPEGGDRDQIRAVAAGVCEIALTNSYYFIRMGAGEEAADREVAGKLRLAYPSLNGQGAHVNVSGGGVAAHSPNRDNALLLLEFLATPKSQAMVSRMNYEYPVSPGVAAPAPVDAYAGFKANPMAVSLYGPRQAEAQSMMSAAGWR
jgi:iron(III) transport system substrate-binding protein